MSSPPIYLNKDAVVAMLAIRGLASLYSESNSGNELGRIYELNPGDDSDTNPNMQTIDRPCMFVLNTLYNLTLRCGLGIMLEPDDDDWIARCPDLPLLYGSDESPFEAVEMLKREIESAHFDLNDNVSKGVKLSKPLERMRSFLNSVTVENA